MKFIHKYQNFKKKLKEIYNDISKGYSHSDDEYTTKLYKYLDENIDDSVKSIEITLTNKKLVNVILNFNNESIIIDVHRSSINNSVFAVTTEYDGNKIAVVYQSIQIIKDFFIDEHMMDDEEPEEEEEEEEPEDEDEDY